MARRVVILGPIRGDEVRAAEITPLDGGAFVQSGKWRVSLARFDGDLYDATVIERTKPWEAERDEQSQRQRDEDLVWEMVMRICPEAKPFYVRVPIPLAASAR